MSATIPTVWPDDIGVDIVSPLAFLKTQATKLEGLTKGILRGEVHTSTHGSFVTHRLELVAPALSDLRKEVLVARHRVGQPYPVEIQAAEFGPGHEDDPDDWEWPWAGTYQELVLLVSKALRSPGVVSEIQSLIARSNEEPEVSE